MSSPEGNSPETPKKKWERPKIRRGPNTLEHNENISKGRKGKGTGPRSAEVIAKISETKLRRNKGRREQQSKK